VCVRACVRVLAWAASQKRTLLDKCSGKYLSCRATDSVKVLKTTESINVNCRISCTIPISFSATSEEQMLILLCQLHVVWRSNSIIWRISEVTLCLLWLVLRWVTLRVSVPSWYVASQQGQLCPSRVANMSTSIGWHVSFCSGEDDCKLLSSIYFALLSAFRHECLNSTSLVVCHHY